MGQLKVYVWKSRLGRPDTRKWFWIVARGLGFFGVTSGYENTHTEAIRAGHKALTGYIIDTYSGVGGRYQG